MSDGIQGAPSGAPAVPETLADCEAVIERGLTSFVEVGQALARIRDARLYLDGHATFEDYCRERWQVSDSRARQLIGAASTVTNVTVEGAPAPSSEGVARELNRASDPVKTWKATVEQYGPKPTARQVKATAESQNGEPKKAKPKRSKRRKAEEATVKGGRVSLSHDAAVYDWVRRKMRQGWLREQIVAASKAGSDGWPVPGQALSNGSFGEVVAAIAHVERTVEAAGRRALWEGPSPSARLREVKGQLKANSNELLRMQARAGELVYILHSMNVEDYDLDEVSLLALTSLYEDLVVLGEWWHRSLASVQARLGDERVERVLEALDAKTVENGASEAEAESAAAMAKRIRSQRDRRLKP